MTKKTKSKRIDSAKLMTFKNYAAHAGLTVQWVYKLAERKEIDVVEVDGVKFVKIE